MALPCLVDEMVWAQILASIKWEHNISRKPQASVAHKTAVKSRFLSNPPAQPLLASCPHRVKPQTIAMPVFCKCRCQISQTRSALPQAPHRHILPLSTTEFRVCHSPQLRRSVPASCSDGYALCLHGCHRLSGRLPALCVDLAGRKQVV
jgi:hypothetical protein